MTIKIILTLFPMTYWVVLGISLLLRTQDSLSKILNLITNLVIMLLLLRFAIIIHEIGHLVFAKLFGGNPKRMILGKGHEVHRFNFFNIKIIINTDFTVGYAIANFKEQNYLKLRQFMYTLGGALTNLIFAYITFILFNFNYHIFSGKNGIDIPSVFIYVNFLMAFFSLIPYNLNYQGIKIPTDGLKLLKIPFEKIEKLKKEINQNDFFEAIELFELKEYDKAIKIFEKYSKIKNTEFSSKLNLGVMYLKKGEIENSLKMHLNCLESLNKKNSSFKAIINNNLAWVHILKQDYKKADFYSKIAFSINQKEKNFQGTRGSSLIEVGKVNQGINLLEPLVNFKYPNSQTLCASMYLFYGFLLLDNKKKANKYLDFILTNSSLLDVDEHQIWNSIKKRTLEKDST